MKILGHTMRKDDWIVIGGVGAAVTAAVAMSGLLKRQGPSEGDVPVDYAQLPAGAAAPPPDFSGLDGLFSSLQSLTSSLATQAPSMSELPMTGTPTVTSPRAITSPKAPRAPSAIQDPRFDTGDVFSRLTFSDKPQFPGDVSGPHDIVYSEGSIVRVTKSGDVYAAPADQDYTGPTGTGLRNPKYVGRLKSSERLPTDALVTGYTRPAAKYPTVISIGGRLGLTPTQLDTLISGGTLTEVISK